MSQYSSTLPSAPNSFWKARWPTVLAFAAGLVVAALSIYGASHFGSIDDSAGSDWIGLALYLCGTIVILSQGCYLLVAALRFRSARRDGR